MGFSQSRNIYFSLCLIPKEEDKPKTITSDFSETQKTI